MKSTAIALGLLVVSCLSGCRKEYTCSCVVTIEARQDANGLWYSFQGKSTTTAYSEKMREKQAKAACDHEEQTLLSTGVNDANGNPVGNNDPNVKFSASCNLK